MKKAVIICTLDAYANSVKPAQLKGYLQKKGYSVDLCSTIMLSRLGEGRVARLLPGLSADHVALYFLEGLSLFSKKQKSAGIKKMIGSFVTRRQLALRGKILQRLLSGEKYDLLICENALDEGVILARVAKTQILDLPSPLAEEIFYGGELSEKEFKRLKKLEKIIYAKADYLSFHWYTYANFVKKQKYAGNNFINLDYGTEKKSRVAHFSKSPKIIFLGYLAGSWVNLPLLEELSKIYSIDVYGGPRIPGLKANYKGYMPSLDMLANYQFGLITITDDPLRRESFSSKQIEYFSYGLPVFTPEWRSDKVLGRGAIPYRADNFGKLIKEYSDKKKWEAKSRVALAIAGKLTWERSLRALDPIVRKSSS